MANLKRSHSKLHLLYYVIQGNFGLYDIQQISCSLFIICVIFIGTLYLFRGHSLPRKITYLYQKCPVHFHTVTHLVKGLSQGHHSGIEEGAEKRLKTQLKYNTRLMQKIFY